MSRTQYLAQNRFFLRFIVCLFLVSSATGLFSQSVGVNERGDSIVVFNDGSWRYYDSTIDKVLKEGKVEETAPIPKPAKA